MGTASTRQRLLRAGTNLEEGEALARPHIVVSEGEGDERADAQQDDEALRLLFERGEDVDERAARPQLGDARLGTASPCRSSAARS